VALEQSLVVHDADEIDVNVTVPKHNVH
jgi:hypothetical protein